LLTFIRLFFCARVAVVAENLFPPEAARLVPGTQDEARPDNGLISFRDGRAFEVLRLARCAADGSYCWLKDQSPVERVGRSIFLYDVPGPQSDAAAVKETTAGKRPGKANPFSE